MHVFLSRNLSYNVKNDNNFFFLIPNVWITPNRAVGSQTIKVEMEGLVIY